MSEPTKPGYYWAKFREDENWQVVLVDDRMVVSVHGVDHRMYLSDFTFGPEVTKPDSLK